MATGMQHRLFGKDADEPFATLNGKIDGAEEGRAVIMYKGRPYVYEDTDGQKWVAYREAVTVFDATVMIDAELSAPGSAIGG